MKRSFRNPKRIFWAALALLMLGAKTAWASSSAAPQPMHIMEGYLPLPWAIFWWLVAIPFWIIGFIKIRQLLRDKPEQRLLLGLSGGFIFVLSALKLPSVTGSSSHPTGTGLGTILYGPFVVTILGTIALIFQALLLAHGGISTLGANSFSMAIGGPLVAYYLVWKPLRGRIPTWLAVFLAAVIADWMTYVITSLELALAFPDPNTGYLGSFLTFAGVFAVTQIPLAIAEGILTVLVFNALQSNAAEELAELGIQGGNV